MLKWMEVIRCEYESYSYLSCCSWVDTVAPCVTLGQITRYILKNWATDEGLLRFGLSLVKFGTKPHLYLVHLNVFGHFHIQQDQHPPIEFGNLQFRGFTHQYQFFSSICTNPHQYQCKILNYKDPQWVISIIETEKSKHMFPYGFLTCYQTCPNWHFGGQHSGWREPLDICWTLWWGPLPRNSGGASSQVIPYHNINYVQIRIIDKE